MPARSRAVRRLSVRVRQVQTQSLEERLGMGWLFVPDAPVRWGCQVLALAEGLRVVEVDRGTPAARLGLRTGDVILQVDDRSIRGSRDFLQVMRRRGQEHCLLVLRAGGSGYVYLDGVL